MIKKATVNLARIIYLFFEKIVQKLPFFNVDALVFFKSRIYISKRIAFFAGFFV